MYLLANRNLEQWRNQVGAGGAERPPRAAVLGKFLDEDYINCLYFAENSNKYSLNHIFMLEMYVFALFQFP